MNSCQWNTCKPRVYCAHGYPDSYSCQCKCSLRLTESYTTNSHFPGKPGLASCRLNYRKTETNNWWPKMAGYANNNTKVKNYNRMLTQHKEIQWTSSTSLYNTYNSQHITVQWMHIYQWHDFNTSSCVTSLLDVLQCYHRHHQSYYYFSIQSTYW